ncbi:MAG TPA: TMEM175 family protein [Nocardioides sp.]|nr:TMEM175 family protein [Nocardioides sp.]
MTAGGLEQAGRERDLDRLLTFVDAIVAIAITLLVLPLVDLTADITADDRVGHVLHEHASDLWSFALSFYVIARIWMGQHEVVGPLVVGSGRVTALLLVWSFTVVVQPFSTSLVARAGEQPITKTLYVGSMALSLVLVGLLRVEITRHPELTDAPQRRGAVGAFTAAGVLVVALVVMLTFPGSSYYPILLLLLEGPVFRLAQRVRNRHST